MHNHHLIYRFYNYYHIFLLRLVTMTEEAKHSFSIQNVKNTSTVQVAENSAIKAELESMNLIILRTVEVVNYQNTVSAEPHLQVPGLLHILPQHVFSQAVKHTASDWCVRGAQTRFSQVAHQAIRILAVKFTQLRRPTVRFSSLDEVSPIKLFLYWVMVKLQIKHNRKDKASQTAETLSQQEEAIVHPSQLQKLLSVRATDAAMVEGKLIRRVSGHDGTLTWTLAWSPRWCRETREKEGNWKKKKISWVYKNWFSVTTDLNSVCNLWPFVILEHTSSTGF